MLVRWRKRVWRCDELACAAATWTETHQLAEPRTRLTRRAVAWAADALAADDTTVSALARRAGVGWCCGVRSPVRLRCGRPTRTGSPA